MPFIKLKDGTVAHVRLAKHGATLTARDQAAFEALAQALRDHNKGGEMTFDDDFAQLHMQGSIKRIPLGRMGLTWPPPERISLRGMVFDRVGYSQITDEERAKMTHVARGAEYRFNKELSEKQPTDGDKPSA